jgi:hypothetical protein
VTRRFRYKTQRAPALIRENARPPRPSRKGDWITGSIKEYIHMTVVLSMTQAESDETIESSKADALKST